MRYYLTMLLAVPTYILIVILALVLIILALIAVVFYAGASKTAHIEKEGARLGEEEGRKSTTGTEPDGKQ